MPLQNEELERFVETFGGALLGFFIRMGLARVDAEDLVQETFATAWKRSDSFACEEGNDRDRLIGGWLNGIARKLLSNFKRKRKYRNFAEGEIEEIPDEVDVQSELIIRMRTEVQALPNEQKQLIETRFYDDASTIVESAKKLNVSPSTVKRLQAAALENLCQ